MSKTPFMPLWVSDFLGDTLGLDAQEVGAYLLLIMAQWQAGGESLDPDKAQRMARCGRAWPRVWGNISHYFSEDDAGIYSKKCRELRANVALKQTTNSRNGALGGKSKSLKAKKAGKANATKTLKRNPDIPYPEPEREGGSEIDKSIPPPPSAAAVSVSDGFIAKLAETVGYDETPRHWLSPSSRSVIAGWMATGLRQIEVLKRAKASREVHPEPPATVQALASFMGPSTRRPAKAPPAPEADIIAFWVKALNGDSFIAPSAINPMLARKIMATGQVDADRFKARGITF